MAWSLSTDNILAALRTAMGTGVTVGSKTFTWAYVAEGPLLRYLETAASYPMLVLVPEDTESRGGAKVLDLTCQVSVYVVLKSAYAETHGVDAALYTAVRMVGEAVLAKVMDDGARQGTDWLRVRFLRAGVVYDATEQYADKGLAVYGFTVEASYYQTEPR